MGCPTSTPLSGGQVFGFNCNISGPLNQYFNFLVDTKPVITLWDAGSNNTLDLSGFTGRSDVNLNPGTFSSCDGLTNNVAIAFNTKIDNVVGSAGNDTFVVNDDGDTINGGAGTNTAVFAGSSAQYAIADNSGTVTVTDGVAGRNGTDVLTNVTFLQFSDARIDTRTFPTTETAQNGSNWGGTSAVFQNTNPDLLLDWQMANGGNVNAIPTVRAASDGRDTPLQNDNSGLAFGWHLANDKHGNPISIAGPAGTQHIS